MTRVSKLVICVLTVIAMACFAGCSSGSSADGSKSAEPEVVKYGLHLGIEYERNLIFAIYDVDVFVDDSVIGTIKQGETLNKEIPLEPGTHSVSFKKTGEDKVLAKSDFTLEEEMHYECSIKSHNDSIDINNELVETASARAERLADEEAKREADKAEEDKAAASAASAQIAQAASSGDEVDAAAARAAYDALTRDQKALVSSDDVAKLEEAEAKAEKARQEKEAAKKKEAEEAAKKKAEEEKAEKARQEEEAKKKAEEKAKSNQVKQEQKAGQTITVDNNDEFKALLQLRDEFDESIGSFAKKYKGKTIEFDGCIADMANHESAKTRYDILIYAMDYDPNSAIGPNFQFRDVAVTSLKWAGEQPDSISTGMNLHFVARVDSYDSNSGLFRLEPIELSLR